MDFWRLLTNNLAPDKLALIEEASNIASEEGTPLYIVGGAVRDLIIGRPVEDLDLVVEGDAETFAYLVAKRLSGHVVSKSQFSTAKVRVGDILLDFITARNEHYHKPGALPQIAHGTIIEDLSRRDFSINTMAVALHLGKEHPLIDQFGGMKDIQDGLIRSLHDKSFTDDATRILRAIRYEQRLGFSLESNTQNFLTRDLRMIDTISGERLRKEFHRCLSEENSIMILSRASELGILTAINPVLRNTLPTLLLAYTAASKKKLNSDLSDHVQLALLAYEMTPEEGESFILRMRMPSRWMSIVRDTISLKSLLSTLSLAALSKAELFQHLASYNDQALRACMLAAKDEDAMQLLLLFLRDLRNIKPALNGKDLIALGIPKGTAVGETLKSLLTARLDGKVTSNSDEAELVRKFLLSSD